MKGRLSLLFLLFGGMIYAQVFTLKPEWKGSTYFSTENKKIPLLLGASNAHIFPDAAAQWAPILSHSIRLANHQEIDQLQIINEKYEPLGENFDLNPQDTFFNQSQVVQIKQYGFIRKQKTVSLVIFPIKNINGKLQKLTELTVQYTLKNNASAAKTSGVRTYANNSVLSSGNWAKIAVFQNGIYKLSYQDLQNLGFQMQTLNPKHLRLYGNGGYMLPKLANTIIKDDLAENPIVVVGEDDGVFNTDDYVLFYGQGPHEIIYGTSNMSHKFNVYSDTTFYFLNADLGNGLRISTQSEVTAPVTQAYTTYNAYTFYEKDLYSLIKSGKTLFGENFSSKATYTFPFSTTNLTPNTTVSIFMEYAHRGDNAILTLSANGASTSGSSTAYNPSYVADYAAIRNLTLNINTNTITTPNIDISVNYAKTGTSDGWLSYIRVNSTKTANLNENYLELTQLQGLGAGAVHQYTVQNASQASFWDVTDIFNVKAIPYQSSGTDAIFKVDATNRKTIVAFNSSGFKSALLMGKVANQDLHGMTPADYYIISHASLLPAANRLAEFHRTNSGLKVAVVPIRQIYQEFSSGKADPVAIRDFLKMHYDRSIVLPQNVLLMGNAGYSVKMPNCLIPIYESDNYNSPIYSIGFDQFFAALDDVDGKLEGLSVDELDMGIGRFPALNLTEAEAMVDKVIRYKTTSNTLGNWRNKVTLIADDMYYEGNYSDPEVAHLVQMESLTNIIETQAPQFNVEKIYSDAYPVLSTAVGKRRPDVKQKIIEQFTKGTLLLNYAGHGNEEGIGHERLFNIADLSTFSNPNTMPLMITATCEFGRYDDPEKNSIGLETFKKTDGGAVALLTTTRLVFASSNQILNENFSKSVFDTSATGEYLTLGEIYMRSMNLSGINSTAFMLLGDPAMKLNYPSKKSAIVKITGLNASATLDTLKALTKIRIEGEIRHKDGSLYSNYNGTLYPTIYDKKATQNTIAKPIAFTQFKNLLFQGKSSITNGKFAFEFVVPKDIDYTYGKGKVSLYFENQTVGNDGNGYNIDLIVGGVNPNPATDTQGPKIELFMNDENFVRGGIVDETPLLIAKIYDENGINTVGNSIGHDITGKLNEDIQDNRILNQYFTYDLNSYQSGKVNYQLEALPDGKHSIRIKAWDIFNNSAEAVTEFVVAKSADLALANVLNYPNPFTTQTNFWFEHNRPGEALKVTVQIYTITGRLVKTLQENILTDGTQVRSLQWDGLDDFGDRIGRGTYLYKIQVQSTKDKQSVSQYQKLVILR